MKILFATGRPFYPDLFGGAERSMHATLQRLSDAGHECQGLATYLEGGSHHTLFSALRLLSFRKVASLKDQRASVPFWRTRPWLLKDAFHARVESFQPDAVFTQLGFSGEIANWSLSLRIPPLVFLRDPVDLHFTVADATNPLIRYVANSQFMADWARDRFGIVTPVLYPPIDVSRLTLGSNPRYITLINPTKDKGIDLAIRMADLLPNSEFLFVESWPMNDEAYRDLLQTIGIRRNITVWRRRKNVQEVYDVSKILIAPSMWPEAFGRVIVEAQACGIPVVGRNIGGIPEAIGCGGRIVEPETQIETEVERWVLAIREIISDECCYSAIQSAALENSRNGPWTPDRTTQALDALLSSLL